MLKTIVIKGRIKRRANSIFAILSLLFAWIVLHTIKRSLLKREIWLVCEKRNEARDNGYHFFKYMRKEHPGVEIYYVITKESPDLHKVKPLGTVVNANSFEHCLLYLACKYSISSQAYGAYPFKLYLFQLRWVKAYLCKKNQRTIHLRHGITVSEYAHQAFDYEKSGIDYFVCSAPREYEFVKTTYGYPDSAIGCIGLCRFDYLLNMPKADGKQILVMPTWRFTLKREKDGVPLQENERFKFSNSSYFKYYSALLNDEKLHQQLRVAGMHLVFYVHYQLQDYSPLIRQFENDVIRIADRFHDDVQQLLISSSVLITDYSSVFFDFAYMDKPILYYHFDYEEFTKTHYAKGYFEFERDGFGPCCYEDGELKNKLHQLIATKCEQIDLYRGRASEFFAERDGRACERTYAAIIGLK